MGYLRRRGWTAWLLLGLAAGCSRQDTECLGNIGRRLLAKTETWSADFKASWKGRYPGPSLGSRVGSRLRWDKMLSEVPIDVQVHGGDIELVGTVPSPEHKQRAVALAETTTGVANVIDSLQVGESTP